MDDKILRAVNNAITKGISDVLTGYNSPLTPIIKRVVDQHVSTIEATIKDAVGSMFDKDLSTLLKSALDDKLAKVLISKVSGEVESTVNEALRDPIVRAKVKLAVLEAIR